MINETDRLFINSTKAVNPMPQDDKLIGVVPIGEYVDFNSLAWSGFSYRGSNTAYELYNNGVDRVENINYVIIGPTVDAVVKEFLKKLAHLKALAFTMKTKVHSPNGGQLVFQSRRDITLHKRVDGRIGISWRGNLAKISSEPKTRPKRVPMSMSGRSILTSKPFATWGDIFPKTSSEIMTTEELGVGDTIIYNAACGMVKINAN